MYRFLLHDSTFLQLLASMYIEVCYQQYNNGFIVYRSLYVYYVNLCRVCLANDYRLRPAIVTTPLQSHLAPGQCNVYSLCMLKAFIFGDNYLGDWFIILNFPGQFKPIYVCYHDVSNPSVHREAGMFSYSPCFDNSAVCSRSRPLHIQGSVAHCCSYCTLFRYFFTNETSLALVHYSACWHTVLELGWLSI